MNFLVGQIDHCAELAWKESTVYAVEKPLGHLDARLYTLEFRRYRKTGIRSRDVCFSLLDAGDIEYFWKLKGLTYSMLRHPVRCLQTNAVRVNHMLKVCWQRFLFDCLSWYAPSQESGRHWELITEGPC